jgi:hypothetical protein
MPYYLYISTAKIDMLGPQLPWYRRPRQTVAQLTWSVAARPPLAHIAVSETRQLEPSLYKRLRAVERELDRTGQVGSLSDDAPWVRSTMEMQWTEMPLLPIRRRSPPCPHAVLFWSRDDTTTLLLGGSARHLVDRRQAPCGPDSNAGGSRAEWLLGLRLSTLARSYAPGAIRRDGFDRFLMDFLARFPGRVAESPLIRAPTQRVTFLARRHMADQIVEDIDPVTGPTSTRLTMATPLYVALAEASE